MRPTARGHPQRRQPSPWRATADLGRKQPSRYPNLSHLLLAAARIANIIAALSGHLGEEPHALSKADDAPARERPCAGSSAPGTGAELAVVLVPQLELQNLFFCIGAGFLIG